jgi:hypothetical protein
MEAGIKIRYMLFGISLELLIDLHRYQAVIRKCSNSKPWFPQKYIPIPAIAVEKPLLAQLSLVESKLLSL